MSDIPSFPYGLGGAQIRSVANLTRGDGESSSPLARRRSGRRITTYPLERANEALDDLRAGRSRARPCWNA